MGLTDTSRFKDHFYCDCVQSIQYLRTKVLIGKTKIIPSLLQIQTCICLQINIYTMDFQHLPIIDLKYIYACMHRYPNTESTPHHLSFPLLNLPTVITIIGSSGDQALEKLNNIFKVTETEGSSSDLNFLIQNCSNYTRIKHLLGSFQFYPNKTIHIDPNEECVLMASYKSDLRTFWNNSSLISFSKSQ